MKKLHWIIAPHDGMLESHDDKNNLFTIYDNNTNGKMNTVAWVDGKRYEFKGDLYECLDFCNRINGYVA